MAGRFCTERQLCFVFYTDNEAAIVTIQQPLSREVFWHIYAKSRDIQAKMPSPKVILNAFLLVTMRVLNSYLQLMKNRTAMICVMEERRILQWKKHRDHVKG